MKKLLLLLLIPVLFSCVHKQHKQVIHRYKEKKDDNTFLYWYIIESADNASQTNYYYSSLDIITDFSDVVFTKSESIPFDEKSVEELTPEQVSQEELSPETQTEFSENAENFGGMTEDEMGDYEGGSTDNESSYDSGSDGGDSDSGSDGGGDGGGGE